MSKSESSDAQSTLNASVRVGIYARVSSDQQAEKQTIQSQVTALRERVATDGHSLPEILCFLDDGVSGATLMRPALEQLRDMAYAGGIRKLYVHSPDRLARKYAWQVLLLDELQSSGVEVVFLNHTMGATPEEDLLLQMQGMFAEYERAKILERSRRGKRHAAQRGRLQCHRVGVGRGVIRISESALTEFLQACTNETTEERKPRVPHRKLKHIKL